MLNQINDLAELCRIQAETINVKCSVLAMKRRQVWKAESINRDQPTSSDQISTAQIPNLTEAAEVVVLADQTINKAKQNLSKQSRLPVSVKRDSTAATKLKPSKGAKNVRNKLSTSAVSSKTTEVMQVQKELEMLVKPPDQHAVAKEEKVKRIDPCFANDCGVLEKSDSSSGNLKKISGLFEDCWMLQRHFLADTTVGNKSKEQFCSRLCCSPECQQVDHNSDLVVEFLQFAPLVLWLRSLFISMNLTADRVRSLSVADALWCFCVVRRLLQISTRLEALSTGVSATSVIKSPLLEVYFPMERRLWIPSYVSVNPVDDYLLGVQADSVQLAFHRSLDLFQYLTVRRFLFSFWCRFISRQGSQSWSASTVRNAYHLCSHRLAPAYVVLESSQKKSLLLSAIGLCRYFKVSTLILPMPSLAVPLFARGVVKKWTNYKYVPPYKELLPPMLKDEVSLSKKGDRSSDAACLQELMSMLSCLKENEFDEKPCVSEIDRYKRCNEVHIRAKRSQKLAEEQGIMTSGSGRGSSSKKLPAKQLNQFLSKFPQPTDVNYGTKQ